MFIIIIIIITSDNSSITDHSKGLNYLQPKWLVTLKTKLSLNGTFTHSARTAVGKKYIFCGLILFLTHFTFSVYTFLSHLYLLNFYLLLAAFILSVIPVLLLVPSHYLFCHMITSSCQYLVYHCFCSPTLSPYQEHF